MLFVPKNARKFFRVDMYVSFNAINLLVPLLNAKESAEKFDHVDMFVFKDATQIPNVQIILAKLKF